MVESDDRNDEKDNSSEDYMVPGVDYDPKTWIVYGGEKPGKSPSATPCFVATAVYGDINAQEVQVLREFRDNVLMETGLGRKAVDLYYSGFGERVADFIKTRASFTIPLIRKGLDSLVQYHKAHK